jgi:Circadian oscillating protein COP23
MKSQLAILVMGVLAANAILLPPAIAQTEGKIYCGQAYDPIDRVNVPATLMSIPDRKAPLKLIVWKSEYFGKEYTPKQRCAIVSPKFQAAHTSGKLQYLITGKHRKSGQPLVCAAKTENEPCRGGSNVLFELKPYGNNEAVLPGLIGTLSGEIGPDITQNSAGDEIADLRSFLTSKD